MSIRFFCDGCGVEKDELKSCRIAGHDDEGGEISEGAGVYCDDCFPKVWAELLSALNADRK